MTPQTSCTEYCPEHRLTSNKVSQLEQSISDIKNDMYECTNSIRESAIILESTTKSIERFNVALDTLAEKIKALEVSDIGRRTWEEKQNEMERKFNNRLITLFTALGALAAAIAVWHTWGS